MLAMIGLAFASGTPVRAAVSLPAAPVPLPIVSGGDLVFSEPYTGSQAAVTQFLSTTFPEMLGLPASPGLSAEVAAVYEQASPPLTAAGVATTTSTSTTTPRARRPTACPGDVRRL